MDTERLDGFRKMILQRLIDSVISATGGSMLMGIMCDEAEWKGDFGIRRKLISSRIAEVTEELTQGLAAVVDKVEKSPP